MWQVIWALHDGDPEAAEAFDARAHEVAERMRAPDARERRAERTLMIRRAQGRAHELLDAAPPAARPSLLLARGDEAAARRELAALDPAALARGPCRLAELAWLAEAGDDRVRAALAPYAHRFVLAPFAGPMGPATAFFRRRARRRAARSRRGPALTRRRTAAS